MERLINFINDAKKAGVKDLTLVFYVAGYTFGKKNMNLRCSATYDQLWDYADEMFTIEYKGDKNLIKDLSISWSLLEENFVLRCDENDVEAKTEVIIELVELFRFKFDSLTIVNNVTNSEFIKQFKDEAKDKLRKELMGELREEISWKYDMIFERERKLSNEIDKFSEIKRTRKNYAIRLKLIELENVINKKPRSSKRSDSVIDVTYEEQMNLLKEVHKIRDMINKL